MAAVTGEIGASASAGASNSSSLSNSRANGTCNSLHLMDVAHVGSPWCRKMMRKRPCRCVNSFDKRQLLESWKPKLGTL